MCEADDRDAAAAGPSSAASGDRIANPVSNRLGPGDTVVIAGGGIAGLALAAALQSNPAPTRPRVVVLERDPTPEARRQGYGVTLSETNAALEGLGILEELRARNTRSCAHWTFHSSGRVLGCGTAPSHVPRHAPSVPAKTQPTCICILFCFYIKSSASRSALKKKVTCSRICQHAVFLPPHTERG